MQSTSSLFPILALIAVTAFCVGIVIAAHVANVRTRTRGLVTPQRLAFALVLTIIHVVTYAWAWGSAFAIGDSGLQAPASLLGLIEVLGFPLMHFRWAHEDLLVLIVPIANGAIWAVTLIAIPLSTHRLLRRLLIRKNETA